MIYQEGEGDRGEIGLKRQQSGAEGRKLVLLSCWLNDKSRLANSGNWRLVATVLGS